MGLLLAALLGYVIGSVPFALVIGKLFYDTDVRQHGSGNLGGTNTGRVLGKKAGFAVMTLDLLKVTLVVYLTMRFFRDPYALALSGISAAVGHCYPLPAGFRGGKAVAGLYGFLFGLWICAGYSAAVFFLPLGVFVTVLSLFKIVSLSSVLSSLFAAIYIGMLHVPNSVKTAVAVFAVLIVLRHHENMVRILHGTESKISWL